MAAMSTGGGEDRLRDLKSVTDSALSYLPLEGLLDELLTRVVEILDVNTAAILLLEDDGRTLVPRAAKGLEEEVHAAGAHRRSERASPGAWPAPARRCGSRTSSTRRS